jgi:cytochrome bd-type quinol oxidase subunit 2
MEILIAAIASLIAAGVGVALAAILHGATYKRMEAKDNYDKGVWAGCITAGYAVLALGALATGLSTYLYTPQIIGSELFLLTVLVFPNLAAVLLLAGYQACKFTVKYGVKFGQSCATIGQRRETPKSGNS